MDAGMSVSLIRRPTGNEANVHVGIELDLLHTYGGTYLINEVSNDALDFVNINICFSQKPQGSFKRIQWQLVGP